MSYKPILIVAGEPNSVFLEIFFKSIKKNTYKSPLILIVNKNILVNQMKFLGFDFKINQINLEKENFKKINNNQINFINVDYNFKGVFRDISSKSNKYIEESFKIALKILKRNPFKKLINGPISKKTFFS